MTLHFTTYYTLFDYLELELNKSLNSYWTDFKKGGCILDGFSGITVLDYNFLLERNGSGPILNSFELDFIDVVFEHLLFTR